MHVTDGTIGAAPDLTHTAAQFPLGTRRTATDGTVLTYVLAGESIGQYDAVALDDNFSAMKLTKALADKGQMIGFAQVALASAAYGWVAIAGHNIRVKLAASCQPRVSLFTTDTAGTLDDASSSQTELLGVAAVNSINTAADAEIMANFPHVNLA